MNFHTAVALACAALALLTTEAAGAPSVQDIRISQHADHVRVVLDLDEAVSFAAAGNNAFELKGLAGGSAVMNAEAKDAPLNRVVLTPQGDNTRLSFDVSGPMSAKAFALTPDSSGGHRLVVDLYKSAAPSPPASANATTASAPLTTPPALTPSSTPAQPAPALASSPAPVAVAAQTPMTPNPAPSAAPAPMISPAMPLSASGTSAALPPQTQLQPASERRAAVPASPLPPTPSVTQRLNAFASAPPEKPAPVAASTPPIDTIAPTASPPAPATPASPSHAEATTPPQPPSIANADPTASRSLLAERALDRGDARAACTFSEEALHAAPQDLRALAVLGGCRLALGDALGARAAFATALEGDPGYHRARIGMAEASAKLGDAAGARANYERVLADNPPTDEAYKIIAAMAALNASLTPPRSARQGS